MERNRKFLSDINNSRCFDRVKVKQFDNLVIEYSLFENGKELDVTGSLIEAMILKSDNTIVIQESGCTILGNNIKIDLNKECTKIDGLAKLEVRISKDNKQITTFETTIEIEKSIFNNEYARKNLVEVLIELQDALSEARQKIISLDTKNNAARENIKSLDLKNATATSNISELDARNRQASTNLESLDNKNTQADRNIKSLDAKNTLANNNITSLNDKNNIANTTKDSLDKWVEENQDLKDLDGRVYNNTSEIKDIKDSAVNGKAIVISEDSPVGTIIWFSGKEINLVDSNVWRVCNGSKLNKNDYLDLWNVIGSNPNYGNNGNETFKLPDLVSGKKSINSVDLEYNTGGNNSNMSAISILKTNMATENSTTMIPFIKILDMSSKGIEIANKLETLDIKTNSNKKEIDNMKESIIQNRPIVISDDTTVGTVTWIAGNQKSLANGWMWASGQVLNKNEYPELFEQLQYTWGGSGNNFNLPNLDKRYIRATSNDLPLGTYQEDTFKAHSHDLVSHSGKKINLTPNFDNGIENYGVDLFQYANIKANTQANTEIWQSASYVGNTGDTETRPKTVVLGAIIKVKQLSKDMQSVAQEWTNFKENGVGLDSESLNLSGQESIIRNTNYNRGLFINERSIGFYDWKNNKQLFGISDIDNACYLGKEDFYFGMHSKSAAGYTKLPNGMIMQWGETGIARGSDTAVITFPIAFPVCCVAFISAQSVNSGNYNDNSNWASSIISKSQGRLVICKGSDQPVHMAYWYAIGY